MIFIVLIVVGLMFVAGVVRKARKGSPSQEASQTTTPTPSTFILGPGDYTREVPGWKDRPYDLHVPTGYDGSKFTPVVLAIHGGGGNSEAQKKLTCPNGDVSNSKCLDKLADREGFIVVYPNGTGFRLKNVRGWNAGGGKDGYACISAKACEENIDDVGYFRTLLDDLEKAVNVDSSRVYATGISNGGAMSYRLACELSDRIAAIAPVGGGYQFPAVASCAPKRPIPMLQIHGTEDPLWPYQGGESASPLMEDRGIMYSITDTIAKWGSINGCAKGAPIQIENLPDTDTADGTTVTMFTYQGCKAGVAHYRVNGGGHTWPQGFQYFGEKVIGKTSQDINANEVIWEFFKKHAISGEVLSPSTLGPGDYEFSLEHDGLTRTYKVHVPPQYDSRSPASAVIYVHGGGGNARSAYLDKMDKTADKFGFILVIPEGTGEVKFGELRASWNGGKWDMGECCGNADDVGFISAMISDIKKNFNVDSKRIYATGISNGGLMVNRLGCELADKIAAIATVAPAGIESSCSPSRSIPVMDIHGTADTCNPYNGGEPSNSFCRNVGYTRMAPDQVVNRWLSINGCAADPKKSKLNEKVSYTTYSNCKEGAEVVFVKVGGMGHAWPSGFESKLLGIYPVSYDISADQIWEFFKENRPSKF